jgi:hypothetical protein
VYLQLLLIHHQDLQTREIHGLTLQLEKFMFITMATGLNPHQAILDLQDLQVLLVHREKLPLSLDQLVQSDQRVLQVHKEIQDQQVHKVYMLLVQLVKQGQLEQKVQQVQKDSVDQQELQVL